MKKLKIFIVLFMFFIMLTSCDFFNYVENREVNNNSDSTIETEKENYSIEIENISQASLYNEKERKEYMNYLVEAKSLIYEAKTIEEIIEIYDKYSKLIGDLKTINDYQTELSEMKEKYINLLNAISSEDNYREKELSIYKECIEKGIKVFNELTTAKEDTFIKIYDIYRENILKIKTKEEYETEETNLQNKKDEYLDKIKDTISVNEFRDEEKEIYNSYISKAAELLDILTDIDDDNFDKIYNVYKDALLNIKTDKEYKIEEKELLDEQNKYIDLLNALSSIDDYREKEQELYSFYLESGIKAIQEETSKDNIVNIYDAYKEIIEGLKTNNQYEQEEALALLQYKEETVKLIKDYVALSLYRENEVNSIKTLITEYESSVNEALTNKAIDDLVVDFKIKVYPYKTDKELYSEELKQLIIDSINEIDNYKIISNYRENEKIIINELIASFDSQVETSLTKEYVTSLVDTYKTLIDSVKDDKTLYEEERIVLIDECYKELLTLVDIDKLDSNAQQSYLNYCNQVLNDMRQLATKELIKNRLSSEKASLYEIGAQNGDEDSLIELQHIYSDDLYNYLDMSLYREEQQNEIKDIIKNQGRIIRTQNNYDNTLLSVDNAHFALDAVLTNDEMWIKEDEQFFIDLHNLYGNDILTPPSSMTEANDCYELAKIIDYYAFYQLDANSFVRDRFRVKITFYDFDVDIVLFSICELINSCVSVDYFYDGKYYVFYLKAYSFGNLSTGGFTYSTSESYFESNYIISNPFKYQKNDKGIKIWNSQQLFYVLEHKYSFVTVYNSNAFLVLNKAIDILNTIIDVSMSDEIKALKIYTYIGKNVSYDTGAWSYNGDVKKIYANNFKLYNSLFSEGVFFDNLAVCRGKCKAYTILCNLVGLECYRVISYDGYHEYNYLKINGKYYISDIDDSRKLNFVSYKYFLFTGIKNTYMFPNIEISSEKLNSFYQDVSFYNISLYNCSEVDLHLIIDKFLKSDYLYINIFFCSELDDNLLNIIKNIAKVNYYNTYNRYENIYLSELILYK